MSTIGDNSKNYVGIESLSQEDKKTLKKVILDVNDSYLRISSENEYVKEAIDAVSEKMNIDKKIVRRLAKSYYKADFEEETEENRQFENFYSVILRAEKIDA